MNYIALRDTPVPARSVAPMGRGIAPANCLFYVNHKADQRVVWKLDDRGWAYGYELVAA